jgi:hypothetical protein
MRKMKETGDTEREMRKIKEMGETGGGRKRERKR